MKRKTDTSSGMGQCGDAIKGNGVALLGRS